MNKSIRISFLLVAALALGSGDTVFARKKKAAAKDKETKKETPYEKLFKGKACETVKGLLTIHKTDNKVYFEIPFNLLNKDMLLGSTISETTSNWFGSVGEKPTDPLHVVFTRTDSIISLRQVNTSYETDVESLRQRIAESTRPAVMHNFGIQAYNPDSTAVVVDVSEFFLADNEQMPPFSPYAPILGGGRWIVKEFKKDKSQLGKVKAFDDNVSVQSSLSYEVNVRDGRYYYIYKLPFTAVLTRSFVLLPEEPMRPRFADPRIGIFYSNKSAFSHENKGIEPRYYANRWRLEPADEIAFRQGRLVEPKQPIVFYVDNAFPESWKKYIRAGVEEWQKAFEEIGFRNAIVAKEFPMDDPAFDPDNLKYSCVRYSPSPVANAMGPSWTDPRTGEILNASVYLYHNLVKLVQDWRFLQTSPADADVRKVMFDEETLGECICYVVAHEVGHCLALMHNMSGSAAIPTDSLRSPSFTGKYGTTYSIMDYARNNYVAQPGDKERGVKLTPPRLGVYDLYAIKWLYSPLLDAKSAKEEVPTLNQWITEKSGDPVYRYGKQQIFARFDPSSVEEDLGDDAMKSSAYGVKNLKYVLDNMSDWVGKDDPDYTFRQGMYNEIVYQYVRYVNHVLLNIGGLYLNERYDGDELPSFAVVPKEKQQRALRFLLEQIGNMDWLNAAKMQAQWPLMSNISSELEDKIFGAVMSRLASVALSAVKDENPETYTPREFLADVQDFVFAPTKKGKTLTVPEKNLQMKLLSNVMLFSGVAKKGISGDPLSVASVSRMIEAPECVKALSRERYGVLPAEWLGMFTNQETVEACGEAVPVPESLPKYLERQGFGYWVNVNSNMVVEPLDHLYFDMLKRIQVLVKSKANTGSEDTRQHYRLLLYKLEQAFK
ncbi:zinc-dependent metalloprotease [Butyricimonas hominis]|uniref:Zinc-dependent metalloprotease n=1 Tax=Butyricimonas hominis TaxID=2763032 RepID=A0ABR7D3Z9_9BACT|nr:zinc-dependent metalloprotease [Butyricimonas hominis]MBC5622668.1 zinc-dependent metalloprotease [Butyricimonas hominis]